LIHKSGSNEIEWSNGASHEETGDEGGGELHTETIFEAHGFDILFNLIVNSHFSCIKNRCSHNVSLETFIESTHTFSGMNLSDVMTYRLIFC